MVDRLSLERRSWLMSRVRGKNTTPEMTVRRQAHAMGLRYRLHRPDLPGRPDLVFTRYRLALFVHGCFWHRHPGCTKASEPKSRTDFWTAKFEQNVERDARALNELHALGWRTAILWECETKDQSALERKLLEIRTETAAM